MYEVFQGKITGSVDSSSCTHDLLVDDDISRTLDDSACFVDLFNTEVTPLNKTMDAAIPTNSKGSIYLGSNLWEKTIPYDPDFKNALDNCMELESFLDGKSGFPETKPPSLHHLNGNDNFRPNGVQPTTSHPNATPYFNSQFNSRFPPNNSSFSRVEDFSPLHTPEHSPVRLSSPPLPVVLNNSSSSSTSTSARSVTYNLPPGTSESTSKLSNSFGSPNAFDNREAMSSNSTIVKTFSSVPSNPNNLKFAATISGSSVLSPTSSACPENSNTSESKNYANLTTPQQKHGGTLVSPVSSGKPKSFLFNSGYSPNESALNSPKTSNLNSDQQASSSSLYHQPFDDSNNLGSSANVSNGTGRGPGRPSNKPGRPKRSGRGPGRKGHAEVPAAPEESEKPVRGRGRGRPRRRAAMCVSYHNYLIPSPEADDVYLDGLDDLASSHSSEYQSSSSPASPIPKNFPRNSSANDSGVDDEALASNPGNKSRSYADDELRLQPGNKKSKKQVRDYVPDGLKDDKYWARRHKNNLAAKRSRDARRVKENQIAFRANYLEEQHAKMGRDLEAAKKTIEELKQRLSKYESV